MSGEITLRELEPADLPAVAALCGQLGYPSTVEEIERRAARLAGRPDHSVVVAVRGGEVIGWIHLSARDTLESDPDVEVAGLVVDERCRGGGVGRQLMAYAERWAASRGRTLVRVRSNVVRERAHAFYKGLGFRIQKTQHTLVKAVAPVTPA